MVYSEHLTTTFMIRPTKLCLQDIGQKSLTIFVQDTCSSLIIKTKLQVPSSSPCHNLNILCPHQFFKLSTTLANHIN